MFFKCSQINFVNKFILKESTIFWVPDYKRIYQQVSPVDLFCCILSLIFMRNRTFELVVQLEIDFSKSNTTWLYSLNIRRDDKQQ